MLQHRGTHLEMYSTMNFAKCVCLRGHSHNQDVSIFSKPSLLELAVSSLLPVLIFFFSVLEFSTCREPRNLGYVVSFTLRGSEVLLWCGVSVVGIMMYGTLCL